MSVFFLTDKIKDLLKPGTVSAMTRLALVNAIYFKGNWLNRFDMKNTKEMPFKLNQVKMYYELHNNHTLCNKHIAHTYIQKAYLNRHD